MSERDAASRLARTPSWKSAGLAVALALGLSACDKLPWMQDEAAGGGAPGGAMPPPEVSVVVVQPQAVPLSTELPGRLEPSRVAQVRARATGILLKRQFAEGSDVKAGQALFEIDPAPYDAALQSAQAQLAQAEAQLAQASATARRFKPLVDVQAVSQQDYDNAHNAEKAAQAQVAASKAAVRVARINRDYAQVTAPIAGRIGRALVTEGALVSAQEGTQLAVVQQIDPLYLNVTQSAAEVLRLRQALQAGELTRAKGGEAASVQLLLENGQAHGQPGRLLFTDLTVDPGTGQVSLRAEVPNPDGMLLPGMYVRARLQQAELEGAMLLPQQALTRGSQGDTVMVISSEGAVEPRPVQVGGTHQGQWIVTGGLQAGEQVMVEGAMKLMMGAKKVKPMPWKPDAAQPEAAQSEAAQAD